jgi:hypothetical protein
MNSRQMDNVTLDNIVNASGEEIFACLPDLESAVTADARSVLFDGRDRVEASHAVRVAFSLLFATGRLLADLRPSMWNEPDGSVAGEPPPGLLSEDDFTKLARLAYRTGRSHGCCCASADAIAASVAKDSSLIAAALGTPPSRESKRSRGKLRRR